MLGSAFGAPIALRVHSGFPNHLHAQGSPSISLEYGSFKVNPKGYSRGWLRESIRFSTDVGSEFFWCRGSDLRQVPSETKQRSSNNAILPLPISFGFTLTRVFRVPSQQHAKAKPMFQVSHAQAQHWNMKQEVTRPAIPKHSKHSGSKVSKF